MKLNHVLKTASILGLVMGVMVGCAGTSEKAPEPQAEAKPAQTAAVQETKTEAVSSQYKVIRGDNLWNISGKGEVYGNPYQWPLIYKANTSKIKDADLIYPGQDLDINKNPSAADVDAAVHHAKTRGSWSIGVVEKSDKAYLSH